MRLAFLSFLFINVTAEVHQPAYRRRRFGADLDEVKTLLPRESNGVLYFKFAQQVTVFVDQLDPLGPDFVINLR
jgi:hypothetical protein